MHITPQSREFSIQNTILHAEDKELFEYYYYYIQRAKRPSIQKRNSTHRRQGDLLEMHPCVLQDLPVTFQAFQPQVLTKATPAYSSYSRDIPVFPDIPDIPVFPVFPDIPVVPDIPDIPVIHDLPAFPGNSTNSTVFQYLQGIHPILRLECIFYNFYSSIGLHRKLHQVPVEQLQTLHYRHYILQRKGDVVISVKRASVNFVDVKMTYFPE